MIYPRETIELQEGDRKLDFGKKELPIPETDEERALFRLMGYLVDSNGTIDPDEFGNVNLGSILAVYGGNITTLKAELLLLKESIEEIIAAGKEEIGEDKTAALEAMSNKLTAVLDSINAVKDDALTAIGTDNDTGARKQAIEALDAAKEAALKAIGESDSEGARKEALAALDAKLTAALQAIGRTDSEGARKSALDAIAAKLTKALEAIAGKETAIDEKVEQASQKASDADDAAALARKWASNPEDVAVADGKYSALHYMLKAQKILEEVTAATMIAPPYPNLEVSYPQQGGDTAIVTMTNNYTGYAGITIRYRTDGQDPTASDPVFTSPQAITVNGTVMVRAFQSGADSKPSPSNSILVQGLKVQTPSYSYNTQTKQLMLSCATTGATIRYTTDGSAPTESSAAYSGAITISATTNFRMKAFKANVIASEEVSFSIVLLPTPAITATRNADNTTCTLTLTNTAAYTALGITALHIKCDSPALDYTINPASTGVLVSKWPCADYKSLSFYAHADGNVSDSAVMPVSIPPYLLPTPAISATRNSATQAAVSVSNYGSYPAGTSIMINGSSYSLAASINVVITRDPVTFSVYAVNASGNYQQSGTASASLVGYLAKPQISGTVDSVLSNITWYEAHYEILLSNASDYDGTETFTVECEGRSNITIGSISDTCNVAEFPLSFVSDNTFLGASFNISTFYCTVTVSKTGYTSASSGDVELTKV